VRWRVLESASPEQYEFMPSPVDYGLVYQQDRRPASVRRCPNVRTQSHTATSDRSVPIHPSMCATSRKLTPEIVQHDGQVAELAIPSLAIDLGFAWLRLAQPEHAARP